MHDDLEQKSLPKMIGTIFMAIFLAIIPLFAGLFVLERLYALRGGW